MSIGRQQSLREVGRVITQAEAQRWRGRYESSSGRQQSAATISKTSLQKIVAAFAEYDGVYFHHALDGDKHHVLVIPYKDGHSLWNVTVIVDANSDSMIDPLMANDMAQQYLAQNPNGPWSHFFGRHVFEEILSNEDFQEMEIAPAVNDAGLPQLLLYVLYSGVSKNGRAHGQVEVYDHSFQCPPNCP